MDKKEVEAKVIEAAKIALFGRTLIIGHEFAMGGYIDEEKIAGAEAEMVGVGLGEEGQLFVEVAIEGLDFNLVLCWEEIEEVR